MPWIGNRNAVAFDPSFIPKSGKHTPGIGYFWSDCAGRALRGIEILGLSVIDADTRLSFHLDAVQTPPTNCIQDNDLSLIDWYAEAIKKHIKLIRILANITKNHYRQSGNEWSKSNDRDQKEGLHPV